jgi:hypothetical protein
VTARRTATGAVPYAADVRRLPVLVAAAVLVGCAGGTGTTNETGTVTTNETGAATPAIRTADAPEATTVIESAEPSVETFAPITLSGEGKNVEEFTIPAGSAAIAEVTHEGKRNFIVHTIDATGELVEGLVNEIGDYDGTVLLESSEDQHPVAFEIDADGAWNITIKPVAEAKAWDPSTTLEGTGDSVFRLVPPSAGLVTLQLTYDGHKNFIVRSYSGDGTDGLANEVGEFSGEVLLPDGTLLLEVKARDGTWTATPG